VLRSIAHALNVSGPPELGESPPARVLAARVCPAECLAVKAWGGVSSSPVGILVACRAPRRRERPVSSVAGQGARKDSKHVACAASTPPARAVISWVAAKANEASFVVLSGLETRPAPRGQ
jgi:hypothetical protein